ncbi:hypothetical protein JC221_038 [Yersinia phage JC221]|nr:hypothetical protein JC221_038 [Yersinia phage JC221]
MSEDLKQFYRDYAEWLENDAPEHPVFCRCYALCSNLIEWRTEKEKEDKPLLDEMWNQFAEAGLSETMPFNNKEIGDLSYIYESCSESFHLNEKRRQWVFEHAK